MSARPLEITLGPLLFNWPPEQVLAFYAAMAQAPVDRVHLGEVVCGKREPLLSAAFAEAATLLRQGGKTVVWSSLAMIASPAERAALRRQLADPAELVEVNDITALAELPPGQAFVAGPLLNVYNEAAAQALMARGCRRLAANVELSLDQIGAIAGACPDLEIEVFAFGRLPLALSGRCYHARLHGRRKDTCQYVCDQDPDGRSVATLEGEPFLALNGVQVMSDAVQLAAQPPDRLRAFGVTALRLSPHTGDMPAVVRAFRAFADGGIDAERLAAEVRQAGAPGPLVDGYLRGAPGRRPLAADR